MGKPLVALVVFLIGILGHSVSGSPPAASWLAGSATLTITPPANGTADYVVPMDEYDESSPGTLVVEFDHGRIPIGNGDTNSHWVRDHVFAYVLALRGADNHTLVITGADVYMFFAPDIEVYFARLRAAVGDDAFAQLRFLSSSTHNHHVSGGRSVSTKNGKRPRKCSFLFFSVGT